MRPIDLMCTECGAPPGVLCDGSAPRSRPSGNRHLPHYARLDGADGKPTRPPDPERFDPVPMMMFSGGPVDLGLPAPPPPVNNFARFSTEFDGGTPAAVRDYMRQMARERQERVEAMCRAAWESTAPEHRWRLTVVYPAGLSFDDPIIMWALFSPAATSASGEAMTGCDLCGVGPDDECTDECPSRLRR